MRMDTVKKGTRKFAAVWLAVVLSALTACGGGSGDGGPSGSPGAEANALSTPQNSGEQPQSGEPQNPREQQKVKVVLDWTPNTNHTGLYVAKAKGYWEERGLDVEIVMPPETGADAMVASGAAEFGVSYQESVTLAREQEVPVVSVAAVIQHNTSGFASPADKNIREPKDFEGKRYGGWGSPVEQAVIESLMQEQGADVGKVEFINIGSADFFTAVRRDIDFAWIYYGWTGVEAELRNFPLNLVYLTDYSKKLDYYTPVLITSEKMIREKPDIVRAFVEGAAAGYGFAIENPDEAADLLLAAVPELDADLVKASQRWLSPRYRDDAPRWGEQKREVWVNYGEWMAEHGLLKPGLDYDAMFTNEFLPGN